MIELILALLAGTLAGTITGLLPGIHINLVFSILLTIPAVFIFQPITAIVFITATAITHTFVDFIPSVFFGAPNEDTALSVLPGHEFLLKGLGHYAIVLSVIGSTLAIILLIVIFPILFFGLPKIYPFINKMMAFFLIWISIFLIIREKEKTISLIIFVMAGFVGISALNLPVKEPLLPLLTGLFGASTLVYSISLNTKPPEQIIKKISFPKKEIIKPTIITALISPICSIFPGLGSSQAAIIGSEILPKKYKINKEQFLILLGSINTLVLATSFITYYLIQKTRTGTISAIAQITPQINLQIIITSLIAASIMAIPITLFLSKKIAKNIHKINYRKISILILIFITLLIIIFSGIFGFCVFIVSSILGLLSIKTRTRRGLLMGALIIPTILYYLPF